LRLEVDATAVVLRARDLRRGEDLDPLFLERPFELRRNRLVFGRHQPREQLDDRDVAPESPEDRGELDSDRAAPHDDNRLRNLLQADRLVAGDDALAIELDA